MLSRLSSAWRSLKPEDIYNNSSWKKSSKSYCNYYNLFSKGLMERNDDSRWFVSQKSCAEGIIVIIHSIKPILLTDYSWTLKTKRDLQWITKGLYVLESLFVHLTKKLILEGGALLSGSNLNTKRLHGLMLLQKIVQDFKIFVQSYLYLAFIKIHSFMNSVEP